MSLVWGGAKTPRADDAVQETRQKSSVALHQDYCKLQVPYRADEPKIGGGYATLPCLVCDMPAAAVHPAGAGQLQSEDGQNSSLCAVRMHGGMPRSAEAERESASLLQDGSAEKASGMAQLPSGMSCACVCVRVVGRGCTGQAAMSCGADGLGLRIDAGHRVTGRDKCVRGWDGVVSVGSGEVVEVGWGW